MATTVNQAKLNNYPRQVYPAFHAAVVVAYWQGLPYLSLEELATLTLEDATPHLRGMLVHWRGLSALPAHNQSMILSHARNLLRNRDRLYSGDPFHYETCAEMARLGVILYYERILEPATATLALEAWKADTLAYCKAQGVKDPRQVLDSYTASGRTPWFPPLPEGVEP